MESEFNLSPRVLLFVAGSLVLLIISRSSLHNPRVHGFYRFFGFEGVLALLLLNGAWGPTISPPWLQLLGQLLVACSILFAALGYFQLRRHGGFHERLDVPENFPFENTAHLVTDGIYRFIRHPMYSSLLLLAWAMLLRYPTLAGGTVLIPTTVCIVMAARVEERENIGFFGERYREYMARSRMFIPFIL
ncbi:MAG TPA: isoprenylcysteine carboxylmethyltransferase family protein [Gammaproteobacteria bacterium]